jgi:hypothetical protein
VTAAALDGDIAEIIGQWFLGIGRHVHLDEAAANP